MLLLGCLRSTQIGAQLKTVYIMHWYPFIDVDTHTVLMKDHVTFFFDKDHLKGTSRNTERALTAQVTIQFWMPLLLDDIYISNTEGALTAQVTRHLQYRGLDTKVTMTWWPDREIDDDDDKGSIIHTHTHIYRERGENKRSYFTREKRTTALKYHRIA